MVTGLQEFKLFSRVAILGGIHTDIVMTVKAVLYKKACRVIGTFKDSEECFAAMDRGEVDVLVIMDLPEHHGGIFLRKQLRHTIATLTPTLLVGSLQHEADLPCLGGVGETVIIKTPLTHESFEKQFNKLVSIWTSPKLKPAVKARMAITSGNEKLGYSKLLELLEDPSPHELISLAIAQYYRRNRDLLMTEKLLYRSYKLGSKNLCILLPLIDIYMSFASPARALDLLQLANKEYDNPNMLCVDLVQANLMLNRTKECIPFLKQMITGDFQAEQAKEILPRIAYSTGHLDVFDRSILFNPDAFDQYQRAWHILSESDAKKRKGQYEQVATAKKRSYLEAVRNNVEQEQEDWGGLDDDLDINEF